MDGKGSRNCGKGKHFSHTSNSRCHGEGPAHYQLKVALCASVNQALVMRPDERDVRGHIQYLCPDAEYGPLDAFKHAPSKDEVNRPFPAMEHGCHKFNLLANQARAKREVYVDGGRTRADVASLDKVLGHRNLTERSANAGLSAWGRRITTGGRSTRTSTAARASVRVAGIPIARRYCSMSGGRSRCDDVPRYALYV